MLIKNPWTPLFNMKTFLHSMANPFSAISFEKKQEKYVEAPRKEKKK